MKIGLLVCDQVLPELTAQYDSYEVMFKSLLLQIDPLLDFQIYSAYANQLPANVDECDVYLSTGSKHSVNDDLPWGTELIDFIAKLHKQKKKFILFILVFLRYFRFLLVFFFLFLFRLVLFP